MSKKILILVVVLYFIAQPVSAIELKENVDFVCIDKGVTAETPPKIKNIEDKNFTDLCPPGKVPKAIYSQSQSQELSKKIKGFPNRTIDNNKKTANSDMLPQSADCSIGACYNWAEVKRYISSTGVDAILTQHDPYVAQNSYHSIAEIGISHKSAGSWPGNLVETGWRKAVNDVTRLFTFWWKDGMGQCYNSECTGWVQSSSKYYPGMPLSVNNDGIDYTIQYRYGNWWVWYNDEWIGYYPGSLWNGLFTEGDLVLYYGEVATSISFPSTITDMGNGFWASNWSAAEIKYPSFLNSSGWILTGRNLEKYISSRNLYTLEPYFAPSDIIRYGGPGLDDFSSFIGLLSPNGETFDTGYTHQILWQYEGKVGPYVKIEVLKPDDTLVETLAGAYYLGDAGYGWYWWDIPLLMTPGSYKVKVTSSSDPLTYWSENPVTIKKGVWPMTIVKPSGGENWTKGSKRTLDWLFFPEKNVDIYLMKGEIQDSIIVNNYSANVIGEGIYDWNIPLSQKTGKDYRIKVVSIDDNTNTKLSNYFTIKLAGDIDGDDKITTSDALLYLRYSVGQKISPYYIGPEDDVTCDGKITTSDALMILRKSVGQNVNLNC